MRYLLAFASALAAAAERDPAEVLKRATEKVLASVHRIPNYTCVQTVNRDYYTPTGDARPRACAVLLKQRQIPSLDLIPRLISTDRLRLEVAMTRKGEIFSWAGASSFEDTGIDRVVNTGPIGSGVFGGFLSAVFKHFGGRLKFERYTLAEGRALMEYSYQVPQAESGYRVKLHGLSNWLVTAYSGTVLVEPETGEVARMTVQTAELPPVAGNCQTITTLDFGMVKIGESSFLLPTRARQRFIYPNGDETENTTSFAGCREYRGESTVTFFQEPERAAGVGTKSAVPTPPSIPGCLRFTLELTTPIQTDTAAAGDPFAGRLVVTLRDDGRKVLARRNTMVKGRLLRVESFRAPSAAAILVLKPEVLEIRGVRVPFAAVLAWDGKANKGREVILLRRGEEHAGAFRFSGDHVVVNRGFRSEWRTVSPPANTRSDVRQDFSVETKVRR